MTLDMAERSNMSQGMKFAVDLLRKHGWTEGKGLGKHEDGISEALKVRVKSDAAGVGHDSAEQFTFHWWDHVFNKTASSISVEPDQDGVQVKKVTEDNTTVSNKKPRKAMANNNMLYGRFIKTATLLSGGEKRVEEGSSTDTSDSSEDEDAKLDLSSATKLTDEDLMKVCGGRTAHKGARHGLTMSAKLSRIEEQERAFLEKYGKKEPSKSNIELCSIAEDPGAGIKEKSNDVPKKSKKKKRKADREEEMENKEMIADQEEEPTKRKKKRNTDYDEKVLIGEQNFTGEENIEPTKKKKKRKKAECEKQMVNDEGIMEEQNVEPIKKRKNRTMVDHAEEMENEEVLGVECSVEEANKRSAKKKKRKMVDHESEEMELNGLDLSPEKGKEDKKKRWKADEDEEDKKQNMEKEEKKSKKKKKKRTKDNEERAEDEEPAPPTEEDVKVRKKKKNKHKEHS